MGGAINVVLNLLLDVIFGFWLGAAGVALSSSVTAAVVLLFFAVRLSGFEPSFELAPIGRTLGLTLLASLPPAVVALIVSWSGITTGNTALGIVALFLIGTVGLLAYFVVGLLLGLEEPRIMLDVALERLRRRRSEARPVR
jgi:peptidoglycan biosynthesis protein MviN/MurJ (putative lipid II flippase)